MDGFRVVGTLSPLSTMTRQQSELPETDEEFASALTSLVRGAHDNGVSVEGGWDVRAARDRTEWGVEIYEVR